LSKKIRRSWRTDLLEKLTLDVTRIGIGNMNAKTAGRSKKAKQLGNAYPGRAGGPSSHTKLSAEMTASSTPKPLQPWRGIYSEALDQLSDCIHRQARPGLPARRSEDPDLQAGGRHVDRAWLGHAGSWRS